MSGYSIDLTRTYTYKEYEKLTNNIIGSIISMRNLTVNGWGDNRQGIGVVLDTRRWHGEVHFKVAWIRNPFNMIPKQRNIGWHSFNRLFIVSKPKGTTNNVNKT